MDSECSGIIGLKKLLHKLYQANPGRELFDEEKASIGRKIATVEIDFDLLIAFKRKGV
jgi:hypothetical protein